jgi:hypothetical protein
MAGPTTTNDLAVAVAPTPRSPAPGPPAPRQSRIKGILQSFKPHNVEDFGAMLDPVALLLTFVFCIVTGGVPWPGDEACSHT